MKWCCLAGPAARDPSIQIVRRAGSRVIARDETILSSRAIDFTGLTLGKTLDGDTAIYVDELISSSSAATDIVVLDGFNMEVVTAAETGDDEEEEAADSLYDQTVRPSELTCQDYNGDGIIDIPISTLMPGYSSSDEDENIYRIDYQNLHDGELLPAYSVVSNREMGYIFLMPDNWVDNVTVRRVTETNEWQFVVYNGDLNSSGTVLLTLKVSSHQDYQDKFSTDVYFTLATKGIFEYTASIPTTDHELSTLNRRYAPGSCSADPANSRAGTARCGLLSINLYIKEVFSSCVRSLLWRTKTISVPLWCSTSSGWAMM